MKVVILAAGMGTRLGKTVPKPLTKLDGKNSILDFQVEKISELVGKENIFVVVGYKKDIIMEEYPDLVFVYNEDYPNTNTAKSLLRALEHIEDDVIWMNGDVYFDSGVLKTLVSSDFSSCLVDNKSCGKEEVKYNTNENGKIRKLSKKVENAEGEALGINMIKQNDLSIFIKELEKVNNDDYFEKALENLTLQGKISLEPVSKRDAFCMEIDFKDDLAQVKDYINSNK